MRRMMILLSVLGSFAIGCAHAQPSYPDHLVRLVVPYPPGGITDTLARLIASRVSDMWNQKMIVENRPGASGNIGMADVARSRPDGYTLVFGNTSTIAINPSLFKNLSFDPAKDFVPVTEVASVSNVLLVAPDFPAKTLGELIALAKSKPGTLSFASNGIGSSNHLAGELLKTTAGIDMLHVPYKSTTEAVVDLTAGRVSVMFGDFTTSIPFIKSGRLRALAVTSAKRTPQLPDVPTMIESGLPGLVITPWWGIFAPAGTPKPIIEKLNHDIVAVLNSKEVLAYLSAQATDVVGNSPEAFAELIKGEAERWGKVVKASGATLD
ncbi:MAG TPA: tripartite tricarboxylate transporter substrate binding protein [Casimicrobiaceae bacterium]